MFCRSAGETICTRNKTLGIQQWRKSKQCILQEAKFKRMPAYCILACQAGRETRTTWKNQPSHNTAWSKHTYESIVYYCHWKKLETVRKEFAKKHAPHTLAAENTRFEKTAMKESKLPQNEHANTSITCTIVKPFGQDCKCKAYQTSAVPVWKSPSNWCHWRFPVNSMRIEIRSSQTSICCRSASAFTFPDLRFQSPRYRVFPSSQH